MSNDVKWGMVSDIHFPLHDPRKVELFLKVMKWWKPDAVDLLGDIDDADSTGKWAIGRETMVSVMDGGVRLTTEFFAQLRDMFPDGDLHYHDGNHGYFRHKKYIEKNAPVMADLLDADTIYQYSKYGVHFHAYDKPPVHRFGDMYGHHGESISKHGGESVRNDCLNWDVSLVRGHSHRMGSYFRTYPITGRTIRGFEIGHLCDEKKMDYIAAPDWQAGFAVAHVVNGFPHMQLIQITNDYTCVVDGKTFKA